MLPTGTPSESMIAAPIAHTARRYCERLIEYPRCLMRSIRALSRRGRTACVAEFRQVRLRISSTCRLAHCTASTARPPLPVAWNG